MPSSFAYAFSSRYCVPAELEHLAVRAVGVGVGVLAVVGAVVHLAREQRAIVALLQLDRVGAADLLGAREHLLALLESPW